jgi:hypothetical protein
VLVAISTPWARRGLHFDTCEENLGKTGSNKLVVHAPTRVLNPTLSEARTRELEPDPRRWRREYAAIPGDTDEGFLRRDEILACVDRGVELRPPVAGVHYVIGADLAFRRDRAVGVVLHREYRRRDNSPPVDLVVVDAVRAWTPQPGAPLRFDRVIDDLAGLARRFGNARIVRDFFSGDAVDSGLRERGVLSRELPMTPAAQAQRFALLAQRIRADTLRLVDHAGLVAELFYYFRK